jgi:hypothetical protein
MRTRKLIKFGLRPVRAEQLQNKGKMLNFSLVFHIGLKDLCNYELPWHVLWIERIYFINLLLHAWTALTLVPFEQFQLVCGYH